MHRVRARAGETGRLRIRTSGQGAGRAHGADAPRARRRACHLPRGGRPRGRDLPRDDAAARADGVLRGPA